MLKVAEAINKQSSVSVSSISSSNDWFSLTLVTLDKIKNTKAPRR